MNLFSWLWVLAVLLACGGKTGLLVPSPQARIDAGTDGSTVDVIPFPDAGTELLGLYETGLRDDRTVVADGGDDPHYDVRKLPGGDWVPARIQRTNRIGAGTFHWMPLPDNIDTDAPISHPEDRQSTDQRYAFRTSFSLPEGLPPSVDSLVFDLGYDDQLSDTTNQFETRINGVTLVQPCADGDQYQSQCVSRIPFALLAGGTNLIEWELRNGITAYGLRVRNVRFE